MPSRYGLGTPTFFAYVSRTISRPNADTIIFMINELEILESQVSIHFSFILKKILDEYLAKNVTLLIKSLDDRPRESRILESLNSLISKLNTSPESKLDLCRSIFSRYTHTFILIYTTKKGR